jgi:hypothetical protein
MPILMWGGHDVPNPNAGKEVSRRKCAGCGIYLSIAERGVEVGGETFHEAAACIVRKLNRIGWQ